MSESLFPFLNDYDWREVFALAGDPEGGENEASISVVPPGEENVSPAKFGRPDVVEIVWQSEGENDGPDWLIGGRLQDERWFFIAAGCDYTGWDCQSGGRAYVAASRENIERYAMGDGERERLGVTLDGERRTEPSGW